MIDALTDLDKAVIEALGAHYARGGEAAFDEMASRLVVTVCTVLAHTRGTARLVDLIKLVEVINAHRRQTTREAAALVAAAAAPAAWQYSPQSAARTVWLDAGFFFAQVL